MAKFNTKTKTSTKTENLAGGEAYKESDKLELVGNLLTSFVENQYYRSKEEGIEKLQKLILKEKDKKFIAKAAIYARTKFGMRSITHITASELAASVKGEKWTKNFYNLVVNRPDDILEILSFYMTNHKDKPIPNSLKKGLGMALSRFNEYQLAKYKGEGKSVKLVDAVNLLHPKHTPAIGALMKGTLANANTWEVKLTQAGQIAETEEEKIEMKKDVWEDLITEKKIGYFALLRNLRNIIKQAPKMVDKACELLTDRKLIEQSLVLPFRFKSAIDQIEILEEPESRKVMVALNKALDISCSNIPKFDGKTLVALDCSGSMSSLKDKAGLFAALICKANDADLIIFDDKGRYFNINTLDSTLTILDSIPFPGGGTDFNQIFLTAKKPYDRIIILSDMESWIGYNCPKVEFNNYTKKYKCNPKIYSWNMSNQSGTLQFPEKDVYVLAGWSEKIFDIMKLLETDKNAMINEIEKVEL